MKVLRIAGAEDSITLDAVVGSATKLVPSESVLMVVRSGILAHTFPVAISSVPVTLNQDMKAITPRPGVSAEFLAYYLRSCGQRILRECSKSGTTVASVDIGALKAQWVPVPPLDEQHRIVAAIETHFSRLDVAVASLTRAKANVKRARASVLKAAVEGRLVPTEAELARAEGRDYEPASVLLQRILEERQAKWAASGAKGKYKEPVAPVTDGLPEVPEGWVWGSMDALVREPLRNGRSAKPSLDGTGVRILTLTAVTTGHFTDANTKLTVATSDQVAGLWLEPGDLLIERSNTPDLVGTAALYRGQRNWAVYPDLLIRARTTLHADVEFLAAALRAPTLRQFFRDRAKGISGSMPKISQDVIQAAPIPLPPFQEQHRIVAEVDRRLSVLDALDTTLDANLARCARLRQAILKRAFEGRLVFSDAPELVPA